MGEGKPRTVVKSELYGVIVPDKLRQVILNLVPHFKKAMAKKLKTRFGFSGSGLKLSGSGSDHEIAQMAMKQLGHH